MSKEEIKAFLGKLVEEYLNDSIDKEGVQSKMINFLDPEEVYDLEDALEITDCFFALKHLDETGDKTTKKELEYFKECFSGKRAYNLDDKFQFLR